MLGRHVENPDGTRIDSLRNAQLIICFSFCVLVEQLSTECVERGLILEKLLLVFFKLFQGYEQIVENRYERKKKHLVL